MNEPGRRTGRLQSIGPFTLIDRIGAGGMGTVYRALDRRSGTVVAFKLLHEHVANDPAAVERFRREAHVASLLRSAYVVRTLEFGQEDGRYYLVTEFIEGRSLAELLAEGPIEPLAAIDVVTHAALALDEAESREIAHRDIKPDNIMVMEDGAARLADFGIATLSYLDGLTRSGSYIGTVAYSAPEQHRGEADIRSDIYSLGVVLYQVFAGQRPFEAATPTEVMRLHTDEPVPTEPLAALPEQLRSVILKCLAKDPSERYQHPSELIAALNAARPAVAAYRPPEPAGAAAAAEASAAPRNEPTATSLPVAAAPPPELPPATRIEPAPEPAGSGPRYGGKWLALGGLAAAVLAGGIAAAAALSGGDDPPPPANGGGDETTTATSTATQTKEAAVPGTSTPSMTVPGSPSPGATFAATQPGGLATATATATQPRPAATATNTTSAPTATPTTAAPAQFASPIFATTLTESGLPPAAGEPSGGTLSGCPIQNIYAYVTHTNVPVGTQLTGSWNFNGQFQASNPVVTTDAVNGGTNYNFGNQQGLPAGTYGFNLRSGLQTVSSGTVTIQC